MKKFISLYFLLISLSFSFLAQNKIFIPREVETAINKGTRTLLGKPGENYRINFADYKIRAFVNPDSSLLRGKETILYHNNSPDTLTKMVFRLYNDIFTCKAVRDYYRENLTTLPPVKIKNIKIGTQTFSDKSTSIRRSSTNLTLFLRKDNHLLPHSTKNIEISWELIIPEKSKLRMGNYGNGEMFVAYWYPQVAVYDDVFGWDRIEYQGIVEFYNDPINNYDVKLTLPQNEIVWATGVLKNPNEVLAPKIYNKYERAKNSYEVVRIIDSTDLASSNISADNEFNTWHFKAENVPDFSFAIGNSMLWDGKAIIVDSTKNRNVFVQAVYPIDAPHWKDAVDIAAESIEILSNQLPGIPFPYPEMTSYCNPSKGGGMETPMMANDGAPKNYQSFVGLIFHEISHTYFPFYMGTNERRFAWMDEGWATFFTGEITKKYSDSTRATYWERITQTYQYSAGEEIDVPPITPSYSVKFGFPRITFYNRPAIAYRELENLLGKNLFKKALLNYINTWHGKHPIPTDFFYSFEKTYGKDLSWFWNPWFYQFGYPDLGINKVEISNDKVFVSVKKIGNIPTSVKLTIHFKNGGTETREVNVKVWKDSNVTTFEFRTQQKKPVKIILGSTEIPDVNQSNNVYEIK